MRNFWSMGCCMLLLTSLSLAQAKVESHWNCGKPSDAHSIDVGDQANHSYAVTKTTCTASKSEVGGVIQNDGIGTQFNETKGDAVTWHGVLVVNAENGDKLHYAYSGKGTLKDGQFQTGTDKWSMIGGTGKFKGGKGEGTCKGKGNADGTATWDCEGTYIPGK